MHYRCTAHLPDTSLIVPFFPKKGDLQLLLELLWRQVSQLAQGVLQHRPAVDHQIQEGAGEKPTVVEVLDHLMVTGHLGKPLPWQWNYHDNNAVPQFSVTMETEHL